MGDGSYLYFVRHTKIHAPVRTRHCIIHFQQPGRFVAVYLRDQRRGLSARHYRVNDSRCSRCRRIYPDPICTRLIDGNWYVCDYVVLFLLDARCRQMEHIDRPNSMEPHRGILVQRCRPSLCLYRAVFGITAKESRPASVELMSRCVMSWAFLPAINALAQEFSLAIDAQHGSTPSRADPRKSAAITAIFQEHALREPLSCRSSAHRKAVEPTNRDAAVRSDRSCATRADSRAG